MFDNLQNIAEKELIAAKAEFSLELEGELTEPYAKKYLGQLYAAIGQTASAGEFVKKGEDLHFQVAHDVYAPLIKGCTQFMAEYFSKKGIEGKVYFALRDAAPLLLAAESVMPAYDLKPVGVHINRPLCGIGDEISPEVVPNGDMAAMIYKYLRQEGAFDNGSVGWVDTGCWGTVPLVLKTHYFQKQDYYPVFLYSHNPKIPDYLHWLVSEAGVTGTDEEALNTINDSAECIFPSPVRRPLVLTEADSLVVPKIKSSSLLSQKWGMAALNGVSGYLAETHGEVISLSDQEKALVTFLLKIDQSKNDTWSGTLWQSTPMWSQGSEFLQKYPKYLFGK